MCFNCKHYNLQRKIYLLPHENSSSSQSFPDYILWQHARGKTDLICTEIPIYFNPKITPQPFMNNFGYPTLSK